MLPLKCSFYCSYLLIPRRRRTPEKMTSAKKAALNHWHKFEMLCCLSARECLLSPQFRFIAVMNGRSNEDERWQTSNKENESQIAVLQWEMFHMCNYSLCIGHGSNNRKTLKLHTNNTSLQLQCRMEGPSTPNQGAQKLKMNGNE